MTCARDRLLIKIAHSALSETGERELLGTDFADNACQRLSMKKKGKTSITPPRTTVASVKKEMQKPRLTESVRSNAKKPFNPSTGPQKAEIRGGFSRAEPH
jgi:hypothetical protein